MQHTQYNYHFIYLGLFVPLTMEGNIIVDEVLASCYASSDHDLVHSATVLVRYFPELIMWIFGEENGFASHPKVMQHMSKWYMPNNHLYEWNKSLDF